MSVSVHTPEGNARPHPRRGPATTGPWPMPSFLVPPGPLHWWQGAYGIVGERSLHVQAPGAGQGPGGAPTCAQCLPP